MLGDQIIYILPTDIEISYGSKIKGLSFSLSCHEFILDKYPGTENPSFYGIASYKILKSKLIPIKGFEYNDKNACAQT